MSSSKGKPPSRVVVSTKTKASTYPSTLKLSLLQIQQHWTKPEVAVDSPSRSVQQTHLVSNFAVPELFEAAALQCLAQSELILPFAASQTQQSGDHTLDVAAAGAHAQRS